MDWKIQALALCAYRLRLGRRPHANQSSPAPKSDQVDDYPGAKVPDPYRPLENPDSPDRGNGLRRENKIPSIF